MMGDATMRTGNMAQKLILRSCDQKVFTNAPEDIRQTIYEKALYLKGEFIKKDPAAGIILNFWKAVD